MDLKPLSLLSAVALSASLAAAQSTRPAAPMDVWLDVDTATGVVTKDRPHDVDDGLAMIYAFHSPELHVDGVSVVFGNTTLEQAVPIATDVVRQFGPAGMAVQAGAASADELGKETDATAALEADLRDRPADRPLTILALGPVTNVATVLKLHPELAGKVGSIVMVAARRPGFRFSPIGRPELVFPDANFEKDAPAMQVLLEANVQLVFAGYEVSSDTWLTPADLEKLAGAGPSGAWIARTSRPWIGMWTQAMKLKGFNPFDTLAVAWLTHPDLFEKVFSTAHLTRGPNDQAPPEARAAGKVPVKPYLMAEPANHESTVLYLTRTDPAFHEILMDRLGGAAPATAPAAMDANK